MSFGIQFLICNIYIVIFIVIIAAIKILLKKYLSERIQYNLWFILFVLLAIPFIPIRLYGIFSWINISLQEISTLNGDNSLGMAANQFSNMERMSDFAISVSANSPSLLNFLILGVWIAGMFAMTVLSIRSWQKLRRIEASALPLQNEAIQKTYHQCLSEVGVKKEIPIYSTLFLESPVTVGMFQPRIYLPIHLISDYDKKEMRYMLLHELQHYRYKDAFVNYLMGLASIIYWFNPVIFYALKMIRCDREIACDTSVLHMLNDAEYMDYGRTLINFAEKISFSVFPFASGIGGNTKQIELRILNIVNYRKDTLFQKIRGGIMYILIMVIILGFAPVLSVYAMDGGQYIFYKDDKNIEYLDLSTAFRGYEGSFVLYDETKDTWSIYNEEKAQIRVSPNSTYKIYDALLGLETGIITSGQSTIKWSGEDYPFEEWEADHDLSSAMKYSVNWYFQTLDSQVGMKTIKSFLKEINYGNQTVSSDLYTYWNDLSLKISPIEQVELLQRFYQNDFQFSEKNIQAVKNSIYLSDSESITLYGKTGTGRIDGQDINGWFIGYIESNNNVYYFATNIQGESGTTGSMATDISRSVLSELNIWQ